MRNTFKNSIGWSTVTYFPSNNIDKFYATRETTIITYNQYSLIWTISYLLPLFHSHYYLELHISYYPKP